MRRAALTAMACFALAGCQAALVTDSPAPSASLPVITISLPPASDAPPTTSPESLPPAPPTPTPSPTLRRTPESQPPMTPIPLGSPTADCVNGWIHPAPDSAEYQAALAMLSAQMGEAGPWTVVEMRYFTGPDVAWIVEPHYDVVERWYVKAALADEASFRARWLLEKRTEEVKGIAAVAGFDTTGYDSPDWTGFTGEGEPISYIGLPGEWSGVPYDFVTGAGDSGQPGLPDEVVGCLSQT